MNVLSLLGAFIQWIRTSCIIFCACIKIILYLWGPGTITKNWSIHQLLSSCVSELALIRSTEVDAISSAAFTLGPGYLHVKFHSNLIVLISIFYTTSTMTEFLNCSSLEKSYMSAKPGDFTEKDSHAPFSQLNLWLVFWFFKILTTPYYTTDCILQY